jgi:hypothetical protein
MIEFTSGAGQSNWLRSMSLDAWKSFFDIGGVLLLALTFLFGAGALITSRKINDLQSAKLREFDKDLTDAKTELGKQQERAAKAEKQLIEQGPRTHLLYGKRRDRIIERLKPFSGQKAEIRYCTVSFNQYFIDNDTMGVAMLLGDILAKAGWSVNPLARENCSGSGLSISTNPQAPGSVQKAAHELLSALLEVQLTVVGSAVSVQESPRPTQPLTIDCGTASGSTSKCENKEVTFPPLGNDTIVLTVLAHP